ncbi:hypothetical protein [Halegenticoccus tardaugens]|uniref:hypothetical protein n=1 Tax=Halegenticoccus tardaugens TaxID=2071624 RepID=UPI00100BB03F|nr:hypothetical protein [Halegenticoccus tardaugens]
MRKDSKQGQYDTSFHAHQNATGEDLIELSVHCENAISEPRIRWRAEHGSVAGKWASLKLPDEAGSPSPAPYETLEVAEPTLVFGRFGGARPTLFDKSTESLSLPADVATKLRDRLVELGTVQEGASISDDPTAFPQTIVDPGLPIEPGRWECAGWDSTQKVMYYQLTRSPSPGSIEWEREAVTSPRPYQIDDGTLIWRKHHLVSVNGSGDEIVEKLELEERG